MDELQYKLYTTNDKMSSIQMAEAASFLHKHLDQYGDEKHDILAAIQYCMQVTPTPGGYVIICTQGGTIIGAVVVNKTGMSGYIPENILVYIAVHQSARGKGVGKYLMKTALKMADGDIALHVEKDNPAIHLYEKIGFEQKYVEMRYYKSKNK